MKKKELLKKLNELQQTHLELLTPQKSTNGTYYEISIPVKSHLDLMLLICHLLEVCVLALGEQEAINELQVRQPEHNIQEVLRLVLHLIPLEELQFVDEVSALLKSIDPDGEEVA
ncbi:hypothetical protein F3C99_06095 [Vitellibacter sp. q18]|jgi:hypothetical protein|nr:hypothetical protein [Aequorivita lutea]